MKAWFIFLFWQGFRCNTIWESIKVFIEEQLADKETPSVTLTTSSMPAGICLGEAETLDPEYGGARNGMVGGRRQVGCPGSAGSSQTQTGSIPGEADYEKQKRASEFQGNHQGRDGWSVMMGLYVLRLQCVCLVGEAASPWCTCRGLLHLWRRWKWWC